MPVAAHCTTAERSAQSDEVRLRILFAAEPATEARNSQQIEKALSSSGQGAGFRGPTATEPAGSSARPAPAPSA